MLMFLTQGHGGVWVVEFDHPGSVGLGLDSSWRQMVCSLDMVNHTRAHTRCLIPGDTVLSPWEPDLRRYGPGRVMAATERRDGLGGTELLMCLCLHFFTAAGSGVDYCYRILHHPCMH